MRRKLSAFIGLGTLGVVLLYASLADSRARQAGDVENLRQQGDRIRLIGPLGPTPELVPPQAPGPGVIA